MRFLIFALLIAGVVLRLYVYLQNRDLIIDEANVARNIYERGFMALLSPLDYEQYAPPIFLWITKLSTLLLGMGEQALKLYPLLSGIAALWLFYKLLKEYIPVQAAWYPVSLMAFSPILIRYSSELKQYMPDVFIALLLIWLALNISIHTISKRRFALLWILIGTVAIWSSMPSVFMLAGVGCYYGWQVLKTKQYKLIILPTLVSLVWVLQFGLYYLLMLQEQANSQYLQNFHRYDFLYATPANGGEWMHNWSVFSALIRQFEGMYPYVHNINTAFLVIGTIMLVRKATAKSILLIIPVLALCTAAALNQFSMMVRVSLFIIPVLILIIGYGFAQHCYLQSVWLKGVIIAAGIYAAGCNIALLTNETFKYEELTEGMSFAQKHKIPGDRVYLYHSSVSSFIYYTNIHPEKDKWADIKDANRLIYETNYDSLGAWLNYSLQPGQEVVFLYTNATEAEFELRNKQPKPHLEAVDSLYLPWVKACVFRDRR
ncbi:MAG: glycosyltransferase family 39 protein [Taibaiella sp.]|nr:glycosyltransferase family 39 protein [Taibaiella sp.]